MKKSTYDAISMIAVVSLVVFTVASQHSSRGGYVFGILAILTAVGLFVAYIKASPKQPSTSAQANKAFEEAIQQASKTVAQREAMERNLRENLNRNLFFKKRAARVYVYEALSNERLKERQLKLFLDAFTVAHHGTADLKAGTYYTQVKVRHEPVQDAASIIANIVEKLCATSKEPRFEFILEPGGTFKIKQVSSKRTVAAEPIPPQQEPVEQPAEPEEPLLIN